MAQGILLEGQSVPGSVKSTNPLPIRIKDGITGNDISPAKSTITKAYAVALAHQAVAHPATVVGSALDVSTKLAMTLLLFHASVEATANTNSGKFLVQVSGASSGTEDWITVYEFDATVSTADTEAMTATEPVGETDLAVSSITGFAANDLLYIQDAGTVGDGEWARCREVVASHIHLVDGLTNAKDSSDVIWNDADMWTCSLDLTAVARVRTIFQCEGAVGANCHIKALVCYGNSK